MILEETDIGRDRISLARLESCVNELLVQKQDPVSKLKVESQIPGSSQFLEGYMLLRVTLYPECIQVALCCLSGLIESAGSWEGKAVTKSKQSLQEGVGGQFNQNTLS